jgi:hypothetical protein
VVFCHATDVSMAETTSFGIALIRVASGTSSPRCGQDPTKIW